MPAYQGIESWRGLEDLRPSLRRLLAPRCGDENEVEDIIQETLLRAARYRPGLISPERLGGWVMRIALNVLHDWRREALRWTTLELDEEADGAPASREATPGEAERELWLTVDGVCIEREELLAVLGQAFLHLRGADRDVLSSYYGGRESCSETAAQCQLSPALVKVRLFRARRRLERFVRRFLCAQRAARCAALA